MAVSSFLSGAKHRLYIIGALLFLWLFGIVLRLTSLQVIQYRDWMQRAQKQQQRLIDVAPSRGIIYDRNGHELAISTLVDSAFAVPSEVPDHATAATLLAGVLGGNAREIRARLDNAKSFCWIARKLDGETSARVKALGLRGIYFHKEPKRFYPKRELAAQVLGYVGTDDEGLAGIELNYDEMLRGIPGRMRISMDARRKRLDRVERQPEPGQNIVLTLDQNIQYIAERELDRAMQETHAEAATVIVQNPRTGEILALANRPTFNPNISRSVTPQSLKDRAVSDVYEPGSMFKTVTVSAALQEKVTTPDEKFDVSQGFIVVGGHRMRDAHRMGVLKVSEVIAQSSNVGAIKIGMKLGEERLYKYIRAYGFGSPTGIELPGETRGLVKPVERWSKTSIGAMSMGQEVGITAIQAATAISAIANDGIYTPPRIVAGTTPPRATPQTVVFRPAEQRRVISPLTAVEMKKMMEGVVLFGTGRRAILDGYTSAGKTGTAQKVDRKTGRYGSKYVASFVGFAPVNTPAITVAVIIDSAVGLHQGGQVCAPVFQRVAQQVLAYLNVPHDAEIRNSNRLLLRAQAKDRDLEESSPDHLGPALDFLAEDPAAVPATSERTARVIAASETKREAASPQRISAPKVPEVSTEDQPQPVSAPAQPVPATGPNGGVVVDVSGGAVVPSFVGMSLRAAVEAAQQSGIEIEAHGHGIAREQSPLPGTRIPLGGRVAVRFAR
ncbi:MAG: penicillin-binding protein [Terriglobales bacterium]